MNKNETAALFNTVAAMVAAGRVSPSAGDELLAAIGAMAGTGKARGEKALLAGPARHGEWFRSVSAARLAAEITFTHKNRAMPCVRAKMDAALAGSIDTQMKLTALAIEAGVWLGREGVWMTCPVERWLRQPGWTHRVALPADMRVAAAPGGHRYLMAAETVVPAPRFWPGGAFLPGAVDLGPLH